MRRVYHHFGGRAVTIEIADGRLRRSDRDELVMRYIPEAGE
ncbi:hypothetical protein Godav_002894 [Gossypium davidsonii]|uniref:Uncharacterized protein n=1 Tax=Gossypium davidsonii TaxID=34287 RepID=A0A7J8SYI6_GOSDV|nr:hypothetical protein [Gossypium davidsonii]